MNKLTFSMGGVHPDDNKIARECPIEVLPLPDTVYVSMAQHLGAPAKPVVAVGDSVKAGQVIAEPAGFISAFVHSPVSGTVKSIAPRKDLAGNPQIHVEIKVEGDEWAEGIDLSKDLVTSIPDDRNAMLDRIKACGVVGLGGATFPTHVKLNPAPGKVAECLIINGAECEPYLTADHRLMLEKPAEIIDGVRLLMLAFDVKETIIGVEDNKPDAIDALKEAAKGVDGVKIMALPVMYPQGGEKQLIYATTRRVVPNGGLPLDVGCVVCNVGTIYAIDQAIREGRPVVDRITTVGGLVQNPRNYRVRVGTPYEVLIEACGGLRDGVKKLLSGGPMMGMAINRLDIPVTKGTSGILALGREGVCADESACIRCGRCMRACPMKLAPAKLDALVRANRLEAAEKMGVMNCLECGACTFACPAKRQLTQSCRTGKRIITTRRKQAQSAQKK